MFIRRKNLVRIEAFNRGLGFAIATNYVTGYPNLPAKAFATAFTVSFMAGTSDTTIEFFKDVWPSVKDDYL